MSKKHVEFELRKVSLFHNECREYRVGDSKWPDFVESMWTLYGRIEDGRAQAIKDFATRGKAMKYIRRMKRRAPLTVFNQLSTKATAGWTGRPKRRKR
jgi:hypothetical protein